MVMISIISDLAILVLAFMTFTASAQYNDVRVVFSPDMECGPSLTSTYTINMDKKIGCIGECTDLSSFIPSNLDVKSVRILNPNSKNYQITCLFWCKDSCNGPSQGVVSSTDICKEIELTSDASMSCYATPNSGSMC